jgi:hypothetical protein
LLYSYLNIIHLFAPHLSLLQAAKMTVVKDLHSGKTALAELATLKYFSQPKKETGLAMILPWNSKLDTWHGNLSVTTKLS